MTKDKPIENDTGYTFHGMAGAPNIFQFPHCETDRFWRKQLAVTPERYIRSG